MALLLPACTARSTEEHSDSGSETASTATATDGTASTSMSPGSTGEPDACAALMNDALGDPIPLTVFNAREVPIFLTSAVSCQPEYFEIVSKVEGMPGQWSGPHCSFTCEDVMAGACGCTADCPVAPTIRIEPGGAYELSWSGAVLRETALPTECASQDCLADTCRVARAAAPGGLYEATLALVESPQCGDTECTCTPNADGWCQLESWGEVPSETPTFEFPAPEPGAEGPVFEIG